ncbi:hypothetical protein [Mediterraneibacter gnavus]|uniref:hypothetical protein n=1 Tax=Mediterraneibacter gnavus TaxID=33038 RepID=UPI0004B6F459|nr:hypothetical protein [Mediterraneibacter gnavus]
MICTKCLYATFPAYEDTGGTGETCTGGNSIEKKQMEQWRSNATKRLKGEK